MKITGIIAEYNPFHNGHRYHLAQTRLRTGCDAIVVVMSGDFVQRGYPAITDKYLRAEAALRCGADLVLELPVYGSAASAEDFAGAGIRALAGLRCVDTLSYGAEDAEVGVDTFRSIAAFLNEEPADYKAVLLRRVKAGNSYAKARALALADFFPQAAELLSKPNNILAVEYERALMRTGAPVASCVISRTDRGYHDTSVAEVCSATAIRETLASGGHFPLQSVPEEIRDLCEPLTASTTISPDDASDMLFAALRAHSQASLSAVYDIPADLANRILSQSEQPFTWTSLAESVKCKAFTRTRIDRALCHALLDITEADADSFKSAECLPYLRVLGVRSDAQGLLAELRKASKIPLLCRLNEDMHALTEPAKVLLTKDLRASALYSQLLFSKCGVTRSDTHRRLLTV